MSGRMPRESSSPAAAACCTGFHQHKPLGSAPGDVIFPELSPLLGAYAQEKLEERGIEVPSHLRVASYLLANHSMVASDSLSGFEFLENSAFIAKKVWGATGSSKLPTAPTQPYGGE